MKTFPLSVLSVSLLFNINFLNVSGQTIAVGHISAEVVEAVSASSEVNTDFQLEYQQTSGNDAAVSNTVHLGKMRIESGYDMACNLTLKPASLFDESGNHIAMETTISSTSGNENNQIRGSQTLELAARATLDSNQPGGLYQGNYTLVFAYN